MYSSYLNRHTLLHVFILISGICYAALSFAEVKLPEVESQYINAEIEDPTRDAGYVIGDILHRKVTLTIKKPYQLVKESLPIVGYEHRYKGQVSGIELSKIDIKTSESADSETYTLDLYYQVFKTDRVAKPAALRAEILKLRNTEKKEVVQYRLPSFNFRISPLSVIGQVKLDQEMYPFIPPLTLDNSKVIFNLKVLAVILALSLLGLLYILGTHAWLPRMGAPFAKAYRDIRKMNDTADGIKQAVTRVHEALNKTAGGSLFSNNLDAFIAKNPAFAPVKQEIEAFFGLSHQVFFQDASHKLNDANQKSWLLKLCRVLRDCERGLTPDLPHGKAA
jgi:mxaA protein